MRDAVLVLTWRNRLFLHDGKSRSRPDGAAVWVLLAVVVVEIVVRNVSNSGVNFWVTITKTPERENAKNSMRV